MNTTPTSKTNSAQKVALGADHAGYERKEFIKSILQNLGFQVSDFGTHNTDSVDYPDFVHPVATAITTGHADWGVLCCGSGNGVAITANKHANIRAALCWSEEIAHLARLHNNANILCIPARFVDQELTQKMLQSFIDTPFEGGRHARRVNKITCT